MMKPPTNELVTLVWLRTVPGLPSQKVSTKLPPSINTISEEGFVTVRTVGGSSNIDVPLRQPVMEVKFWACHPEGDDREPPWAKANDLAEALKDFCEDVGFTNFGGVLTTKSGYDNACVPSAYTLSEPLKILDDDARFACYSMDVQVNWTRRRA